MARSRTRALSLLVGFVLVFSFALPAAAAVAFQRVLVGFSGRPNPRVVQAVGGRVEEVFTLVPAIAAVLPEAAVSALARRPGVAYVEPDYPVYAYDAVAAPFALGLQAAVYDPDTEVLPWGIARVGAPAIWTAVPGNDGSEIRVGIIDTGLDYTHPDLAGRYVGGRDFVNGDADPRDDNGHGTHVAGIIAAQMDGPNSGGANITGVSVIGVAPGASLYIMKVLDRNGSGLTSKIVAALQSAAGNGVDIVNMSLGSYFGSTTLKNACANANAAGVLLIAAAGNDGMRYISYPARYASVVAVGATNSANQRASFSNYGSDLELCAPGVGVLSTLPTYAVRLNNSPYFFQQRYDYLSGTSMASPHVAGVAALVWAQNPGWTNTQVRQQLQLTATDLGALGKDIRYGYGLVNAAEAAAP